MNATTLDPAPAPTGVLLIGNAMTELREMVGPSSVQTCVTSPPYFRQRVYTDDAREIGRESSVSDYVDHLRQVFREVRRVLRDDGTCWLNLDDSYPSGQLVGAPWRVALALQADGWHLRCDVVWEKPNCLPSSVSNRPTRSHEYLFLFSKQASGYYYDGEAIREPWTGQRKSDHARARAKHPGYSGKHADGAQAAGFKGAPKGDPDKGRNKRSVWTVSAPRFAGRHFATMPESIAETCILAGSRPGDLVLDPFAGAGTTLATARKLGRRWLGIELNPSYEPLIRARVDEPCSDYRQYEAGRHALVDEPIKRRQHPELQSKPDVHSTPQSGPPVKAMQTGAAPLPPRQQSVVNAQEAPVSTHVFEQNPRGAQLMSVAPALIGAQQPD